MNEQAYRRGHSVLLEYMENHHYHGIDDDLICDILADIQIFVRGSSKEYVGRWDEILSRASNHADIELHPNYSLEQGEIV